MPSCRTKQTNACRLFALGRANSALLTGQHTTDIVYGEKSIVPGLQSFALGHYGRRQTAEGASASLSPAGVSEYIYIPTAQGPMPIAAEIDGRLHAVHTDQLNTPRQLTDANGNKVWQWAISGFGEVEATTAQTGWIRERNGSAGARDGTLPISFNLRFPGQQFDEESGLHYNHHRYYDPYLTVGYAEADPVGFADADGRHPVVMGLIGAGVVFMAYGFVEFQGYVHECSMCTNHLLQDKPDYQCIQPRDDGWIGPLFSCMFFAA